MSKLARLRILFPKWVFSGLLIASLFAFAVPGLAQADTPTTETYFICPSVSTHNPNGMWVVGHHGAYYVNIPTQGGVNSGSKVYLTIPVSVPSLAQVPAGWGLYKDLSSYPNFEGMAVLLSEGISTWLGGPAGWTEGDIAVVTNNGDGTYTVHNMGPMMAPADKGSITIDHAVPLASAAVW
jgi:hypothetical protein